MRSKISSWLATRVLLWLAGMPHPSRARCLRRLRATLVAAPVLRLLAWLTMHECPYDSLVDIGAGCVNHVTMLQQASKLPQGPHRASVIEGVDMLSWYQRLLEADAIHSPIKLFGFTTSLNLAKAMLVSTGSAVAVLASFLSRAAN